MPEQKQPTAGIQTRTAQIEVRAVADNSNQIELSFSSEFPVDRWYGTEILLHDDNAVDLQRLLTVGTVLFSHGRDILGKMPVAKIDKAWVDSVDRKCRAIITFDEDEDSQKVKNKALNGFIKGVSFGYDVSSWEEVMAGKTSSNGRFTGPAYIALKWEPYEISIEPTPADPTVGKGRNMDDDIAGERHNPYKRNIGGKDNSLSLFERQLQINKNFL